LVSDIQLLVLVTGGSMVP